MKQLYDPFLYHTNTHTNTLYHTRDMIYLNNKVIAKQQFQKNKIIL